MSKASNVRRAVLLSVVPTNKYCPAPLLKIPFGVSYKVLSFEGFKEWVACSPGLNDGTVAVGRSSVGLGVSVRAGLSVGVGNTVGVGVGSTVGVGVDVGVGLGVRIGVGVGLAPVFGVVVPMGVVADESCFGRIEFLLFCTSTVSGLASEPMWVGMVGVGGCVVLVQATENKVKAIAKRTDKFILVSSQQNLYLELGPVINYS